MEHVMVPVPEEHLAEVKQYLQWNTASVPMGSWDTDAAAHFVTSLDELAARVLMHAAAAADEVVVLTIPDAAAAAGCTEREILGLVVELNAAARAASGPPFILATALVHGTTETGPQGWTLNMPGDVARLFRADAARSDP
jgi:hypothetical protein